MRALGDRSWRDASYLSETGYPDTALATAPNGRAISIDANLRVQDFDALPYAARPRVRNLRAKVVAGRIQASFTLSGTALVRPFAIQSETLRHRGGIAPRVLAKGRHTLTLARVARGRYRAALRACTASLGCVETISAEVRVR